MDYLKLFHVFFVFIWIGSLFYLTRLLMSKPSELEIEKYKTLYFTIELPSMVLAVSLGILLLLVKEINMKAGWFHMKMTFAALLIVCDILAGFRLFKRAQGNAIKEKVLHIFVALFLFGVLLSIYVFKSSAF